MSNLPYPPNPDDPTIQDLRATREPRPQAYYADGRQHEPRPQAHYADGRQVESRTEYIEDQNLMRANLRYWVTRVVYFVLAVLEVIMGLRFIFRLLGANPDSSFVMVLYNLSLVFVAPFNGIFNDQTIGRMSVFEISTLIAMLIYALIAWGLVALSRLILAPLLTNEQGDIRSRHSRTTP